VIFQILINLSQNLNKGIRLNTFRIIVDIAKYYYDFINEDMIDFVDLIKIHVKIFYLILITKIKIKR